MTRQHYGLIIALDEWKHWRISLPHVPSLAQIVLFNCRFHFYFLSLEMRFASASDSKNICLPGCYCNARASQPKRVISSWEVATCPYRSSERNAYTDSVVGKCRPDFGTISSS